MSYDVLSVSTYGILTDLVDPNIISLIGSYGFLSFILTESVNIISLTSGIQTSLNETSKLIRDSNLDSSSSRETNLTSGV